MFCIFFQHIPMAVLYGVFLYMGISSLKGMQLVNRLMILFMPMKYQPDYTYLRHVPTRRVHMFTVIQVFCLVLLWVVKAVKAISMMFPIMVRRLFLNNAKKFYLLLYSIALKTHSL